MCPVDAHTVRVCVYMHWVHDNATHTPTAAGCVCTHDANVSTEVMQVDPHGHTHTCVTCHVTGSDQSGLETTKSIMHADANKQNKQQKVLHFKHKVFSILSWQLKLFQLLPLAHFFKLLQHELEGVLGLVVGNARHDVLHRTSRSTRRSSRSRLRICSCLH